MGCPARKGGVNGRLSSTGFSISVFVLQVAEDGKVREGAETEGSVNADAKACVDKAMGALQFDPFCGDDVEVRWRIGVE